MNKKFNLGVALGLAVSLLMAFGVQAAEFVIPGSQDPNLTISANEQHKNLYLAGGNVTVNGSTLGDLMVAGAVVSIVGDVEQDLTTVGGSLSLSGKIGDDARVGGGNVTINSPIGGDLVLGGGNVALTQKASVGGDLIAGAGNLILDAPVKGQVKVAGGNITINSRIEGDVNVVVGGKNAREGRLVFGPNAEILGMVRYKGPAEPIIQPGAKVGNIEYTPYTGRSVIKTGWRALATAGFLIKLVAWMIAGLMLIRFKRLWLKNIAEGVRSRPWESFGWGLVGLLLLPILALLLFLSVVGYYLAFLLGLWYVLMMVFVNLAAAIVTGDLIMKYLAKHNEGLFNWQTVILGVVVFSLLKFIPVLGWIVMVVIYLLTFGSALKLAKDRFQSEN